MIYWKDTPAKAYKGNGKPVHIYYGSDKVAGWHETVQEGEDVAFSGTYNDTASVTVSGSSIQDGTPCPDAPVEVSSAGECNLIATDGGAQSEAFSLPTLRRIGDVADSYNPATGEYTRRIGGLVLNGTETWQYYSGRAYMYPPQAIGELKGLCSHFVHNADYNLSALADGEFNTSPIQNRLGFYNASIPDVNGFKAWLAGQDTAGTPVTVYYELAEPVTTVLDPMEVPTFYPYTVFTTDGQVKAGIAATVKVVDTE